jgi:hypothetical protein
MKIFLTFSSYYKNGISLVETLENLNYSIISTVLLLSNDHLFSKLCRVYSRARLTSYLDSYFRLV